jgi:hypothetical protein
MADSYVQLPSDGSGKRMRTYKRGANANDPHDPYVIPVPDRIISNFGTVASFRTPGRAATDQKIFAISNANGSSILVAVKRLVLQLDATAVLTAVMPVARTYRCATTALSNGTTLTKQRLDTTYSASSSVVCWGDASADGTNSASALAVSAVGDPVWQQFSMRLHTAVGQVLAPDNFMIPASCEDVPLILQANEALVIRVDAAATTSNPTTNHWWVQAAWEEYTRP